MQQVEGAPHSRGTGDPAPSRASNPDFSKELGDATHIPARKNRPNTTRCGKEHGGSPAQPSTFCTVPTETHSSKSGSSHKSVPATVTVFRREGVDVSLLDLIPFPAILHLSREDQRWSERFGSIWLSNKSAFEML